MAHHGSLSQERWATFTVDQQLLMIANEMNRASKLMGFEDQDRRKSAYARVLQLTDLTVDANPRRGLRRELLRWRDLIAQLWLERAGAPGRHREAFRCLLRFSPGTATQLPSRFGREPAGR